MNDGLKFEYKGYGTHIHHEYNGEEEDIYDILEKFKYFLFAKGYLPDMIDKVVYLSDDQAAKLNLVD